MNDAPQDASRSQNASHLHGSRPGIDRRTFLGAVGAAAAVTLLPQQPVHANQAAQDYYYQDSFGAVGPAGEGAIELGVYPPPVLAPMTVQADGSTTAATFYSPGYPQYNILMIVVDQMRNPAFWVPAANTTSTGQQIVNSSITNISGLANTSFYFPHYFTAATICGPARACLLTGLYAQQHCLFQSSLPDTTESTPPLLPYNPAWLPGSTTENPGFPTIGNVLSQPVAANNNMSMLQYDCTWIGKWHLSCVTGTADGSNGQNGPRDYGFNPTYSIPNIWDGAYSSPYAGIAYPSPNGLQNEGVGGDFLDSFTQSPPGRDVPLFIPTTFNNNNAFPGFVQLNDAAIAWAFTNVWLPYANTNLNKNNGSQLLTPWFCGVSFINPHDITDFPFTYGLTITPNSNFSGGEMTSYGANYQPAPANLTSNLTYSGNDCLAGSCGTGDEMFIPMFPSAYSNLPPGAPSAGNYWNYENLSSPQLQYANYGKPGLQLAFQQIHDRTAGVIASPGAYNTTTDSWPNPAAWTTFLNYYLWMQSCVDYQVGEVLGTNPSSATVNPGLMQYPKFWKNTVVVFTSDHGEYGGSHGLHTKGGAVYDESLNVPLYISYPSMRQAGMTAPIPLTYTCSSVDLLPFLYSLALGNEYWRSNANDMVYYLSGRESILDAIYKSSHSSYVLQQRRVSGVPVYNNSIAVSAGNYQPFILHTSDDIPVLLSGSSPPSHVIGFRTVDATDVNSNSAPFYPGNSYGGGKLGIYNYWDTCGQMSAPIFPINPSGPGSAQSQYEFYNYSPHPHVGSLNANPQETLNQFFDPTTGLKTAQGLNYYENFYGIGAVQGNNVQAELYNLNAGTSPGNNTQQVQAAIQVAYTNYRTFLINTGNSTGSDGRPKSC